MQEVFTPGVNDVSRTTFVRVRTPRGAPPGNAGVASGHHRHHGLADHGIRSLLALWLFIGIGQEPVPQLTVQ
jgi:hypothetical protein